MKVREGFVSNSSSSSFVCDFCGGAESGWDAGLSDCEMSECLHGHIVHNSHLHDPVEHVEDKWGDEKVSPHSCPVCRMEHIDGEDVARYLAKIHGTDVSAVRQEMREKFGMVQAFLDWVKA